MTECEREYRRLSQATPEQSHPLYQQFLGAKQALGWVLDPTVVRSPADILVGTEELPGAT